MYLKSLEVQGFKSFPDKTLIRFGDDITAIVGPNGSGKSNISDAIVWVMGEMSSKTLRGAKMEDVIFGGTQKRSAVGFAEATLTLDNSDRALSYDADEVMVTRRYYRSGDSEYYINRQSARLRDIHELFMDTGLGKEGYSNIGQGRIDEILALKSTDRREIFEEAAGISKYRHRKEETERKLGHTEDNLTRIGDKISELELQLEPLRVQSEKAKKYLTLKEELQGIEIAVWLEKLEKLSAEAEKAQQDYASAAFVLQQAHEQLDGLYQSSQTLGTDLRARGEDVENLRVQLSMLDGAYQQIQGQIAVLQASVANNEENIRRSQEDLQGQADRSSGITAQIQQTRQRMEQLLLQQAQQRQQLEQVQQQLHSMSANAQGQQQEFIRLRSQQVQLSADIASNEAALQALSLAREQSRERCDQLEQDLQSGDERLELLRRQLDACRQQLQQARQEVTVLTNAIAGYTLRQNTRGKRAQELEEKLQEQKNRLDTLRNKSRVFRAMEQDMEGYQKSVRQVMQQSRQGSLRNVHGPVSQLIRTDDAYTVAIEIALGMAMQNIVVENEQDGKAAMAWLKRTGGGRATFLPISVIRGRELEEKGLENCAGFVDLASRLVHCQDRYRGIIDNLLGRTVIVETMDHAIALAKKYSHRFRIVTLDGQVIHAGGSMTGGSVQKEAGILSRANELERLEKEEKSLAQALAQLQEQATEARRSADQVAFQLLAAREQLAEQEKTVLTLEGQEKQHELLLEAVSDAARLARQELQALCQRRQLDDQNAAAAQAKLELFTTQKAQNEAALAVLEHTQSDMEQQVSRLTDQMGVLRSDIAALEAEHTAAQAHIADLQVLRSAAEGDRERKLSDIDVIREQNRLLEQQIHQARQRLQENSLQIDQTRKNLDQALATYAATEAEKSRAETQIQELHKSVNNMERACALLENKKETTGIEERNTVDRLWETYGLTPSTAREKRAQIESVSAATRRIAELKRGISALGTPNLGAIEEFARVNERYSYLAQQRDDVLDAKKDLEGIIRELTTQMTQIFVEEFKKIDAYFSQTFVEMFGGGKGQLVLEDPNEPLTCGIEIRVQPPGKQLKTITLLSGGEKAFVAIALYFAILKVRPTPFCMLDEIDAALDDGNVRRFANYLRNLSEKTQFIVITHRRGTMEASDVLYGVTMQEQGISKLLRLDLNQMEQQLGLTEA